MLSRLKSAWSALTGPAFDAAAAFDDALQRSALESGETTRFNRDHWAGVLDQPINDSIAERGETIRARARHEAWNNSNLEGLILSHSLAVAGDEGPLLDLWGETSEDDRWCQEAEQVWEDWCDDCDAGGQFNLGARIKQLWNRGCWTDGDSIDQLIYDRNAPGPIKLRLFGIEQPRLRTPASHWNDPKVVLGVERSRTRRPVRYWISDDWYSDSGTWIPAPWILHIFDAREVGQARGVPWASSGLPVAAELREYDDAVMEAARNAAEMALLAVSNHPEAKFMKTANEMKLKRRALNHVAPGWDVKMMQSQQPHATYKEHRHERLGDMGRGQGVPSMVTRLDAREHNYSSARFDYSLMHLSAKHCRASFYNPAIFRLVSLVVGEAILRNVVGPPPKRYWKSLIWPAQPKIDEQKAANAERTFIDSGTVSYSEACATNHGRRAADVIRSRQRDARLLAEAGLTPAGRQRR
jgi:lambda family phage portal protein